MRDEKNIIFFRVFFEKVDLVDKRLFFMTNRPFFVLLEQSYAYNYLHTNRQHLSTDRKISKNHQISQQYFAFKKSITEVSQKPF